LTRPFERLFSSMYNQSDGLVVLSEGLRSYWRERGVTAPIHVIPRAVQPEVFDRPLGDDPYTHLLERESLPQRGPRLMCAGRHTREKAQDRVIRIFARNVLPLERDATLTMVGDGPDTDFYKGVADDEGAAHRVFFTAEVPWTQLAAFKPPVVQRDPRGPGELGSGSRDVGEGRVDVAQGNGGALDLESDAGRGSDGFDEAA